MGNYKVIRDCDFVPKYTKESVPWKDVNLVKSSQGFSVDTDVI